MPFDDYTFVSQTNDPSGVTGDHGYNPDFFNSKQVVAQEGSGIANGEFTPANTTFVQSRNGRFTFIIPPIQLAFNITQNWHIDFFKQGDGRSFRFTAEARSQNFKMGWIFKVSTRVGGSNSDMLSWHEPDVIDSATGYVVQIEWVTNGAQSTPISSDLAAPDLPNWTFTVRYARDTQDPDDAKTIACQFVDSDFAANLAETYGVKIGQALLDFGAGWYDVLFAVDQAFSQNLINGFNLLGPGSGPIWQQTLLQAQAGFTFTDEYFNAIFSVNANRVGFTGVGTLGTAGWIEPQEPESWSGEMNGFRYDLIGQDELVIVIIEEIWPDPAGLDPDEIFSDQFELPPGLTPSLIHSDDFDFAGNPAVTVRKTETWES